MRLIILALLLIAETPWAALPPKVEQALKASGIAPQAVAVVVQPIDGKTPGLRHRADEPMNPASLMKLLTTFGALELLGPAATWRTEVLAATPPQQGVMSGDLYLRGSGDPKLTYDRLWLLLRELRARGLREIRGNLVLDRSAFTGAEHDPSAFDAKPLRPYNVGADALLFNFATLHMTLWSEGNAVKLIGEPLPAGYEIVNRLQASNEAGCGEWRERLDARFAPGQIILSGPFPRACGEKRWHLAGLPNAVLLHGYFTRLWRELGGEFAGQVREAAAPADAVLLATSESPALGELVRDINKYSNNVMAQQLYLKVGSGSPVEAETILRNWLLSKRLGFPELIIENGSGLSRRHRIAAQSLSRLLEAGWRSAVMPELIASLPIVAADGTTKKRYNGVSYAGQAHLKTGSLEGVRGIAGYLLDRQGRRHIVVFMVNHPKAAEAQPAFDALLEAVWRGDS